MNIVIKILWVLLAAVVGQFYNPIPEEWFKGQGWKKVLRAALVALFFAFVAADMEVDYQFGLGEFAAEEAVCQQVVE